MTSKQALLAVGTKVEIIECADIVSYGDDTPGTQGIITNRFGRITGKDITPESGFAGKKVTGQAGKRLDHYYVRFERAGDSIAPYHVSILAVDEFKVIS